MRTSEVCYFTSGYFPIDVVSSRDIAEGRERLGSGGVQVRFEAELVLRLPSLSPVPGTMGVCGKSDGVMTTALPCAFTTL